jgi:hypothetical protein
LRRRESVLGGLSLCPPEECRGMIPQQSKSKLCFLPTSLLHHFIVDSSESIFLPSVESYLGIELEPPTTSVSFSTTISQSELAVWFSCWFLPANFTKQEEWHWSWKICSARRRGLRICGLERAASNTVDVCSWVRIKP